MQLGRLRRGDGGPAGLEPSVVELEPDGADQTDVVTGGPQRRLQQVRRRGLAVRAGDPEQPQPAGRDGRRRGRPGPGPVTSGRGERHRRPRRAPAAERPLPTGGVGEHGAGRRARPPRRRSRHRARWRRARRRTGRRGAPAASRRSRRVNRIGLAGSGGPRDRAAADDPAADSSVAPADPGQPGRAQARRRTAAVSCHHGPTVPSPASDGVRGRPRLARHHVDLLRPSGPYFLVGSTE